MCEQSVYHCAQCHGSAELLSWRLQDFPTNFLQISSPLVAASVEAYNRISEELLPTPARSHYTFNLRDLSKVFQVSFTSTMMSKQLSKALTAHRLADGCHKTSVPWLAL